MSEKSLCEGFYGWELDDDDDEDEEGRDWDPAGCSAVQCSAVSERGVISGGISRNFFSFFLEHSLAVRWALSCD